ncbi:MAG: hypothetical protein AAF466_05345 [Bacteroidota bacterium]
MRKFIFGYMILGFLFAGCRTVIPERDSVSPKFLFRIENRAYTLDITETFDFDNRALYLKRGETYRIVYTGNDQGGLAFLTWILPNNRSFRIPNSFFGSCTIEDAGTDRMRVQCAGDRSDPRTGLVITADLIVNGVTTSSVEEYEFNLNAQDYFANGTNKFLAVRIHNDAPRTGRR